MNHIYRLIWNTTLACWVVASEHTRSRGKATRAGRAMLTAATLALAMPAGAVDALDATAEDVADVLEQRQDSVQSSVPFAVQKEAIILFSEPPQGGALLATPLAVHYQSAIVSDAYYANATLNGENSMVLGSRARVTGNRATGIGNEVVIQGGGHTAIGSKATATGGIDGVAVGINALADGTGNVAIGEAARADTVEGTSAGIHAVAIGARARAGSPGWTGALAVGGESVATHDAVALGYSAKAQNNGAVAVGREASGAGVGAVAMGRYATASAAGAIAIGDGAQTANANAIAIGRSAKTNGNQSLAVGLRAQASGTSAMVLGMDAEAMGNYTTALGHQAKAGSAWTNAIGYQAEAMGASSVALGTLAKSAANNSLALGDRAQTGDNATYAVALGASASATGYASLAVGTSSKAQAESTIAFGNGAQATQVHASAVGRLAKADGASAVALGNQAQAIDASSIAVGTQASAAGNQSLAVGLRAKANGQTAMVLGMDAEATGNYTTAVGHQAKAGSAWTNAIGYQAEAMGSSSVALGTLAKSAASGSIAVGDRAQVDATAGSSLALGHHAGVNAGATNAVALGASSVATAANTVSVGAASLKRKIVNIADGEVSATSSDAVSGKQLHAVNNRFDGQTIALGTNAQPGGGRAVAIGANATVATGGGYDGIAIGGNARAGVNGYGGPVAIGGFATAEYDGLALGYQASALAGGSVALGRGSVANAGNVVSVGNDTLKRRIVNVADGSVAAASGDAVNGKQLFATNQNVTTATQTANTAKTTADAAQVEAVAANSKANEVSGLIGQASAAGNMRVGAENTGTVLDVRNKVGANRTISGVADGALSVTSTDAVSGKQLFATNQAVTTATHIANTATTKADAAQVEATTALDKATLLNGLVSQAAPNGAVRLGGENAGVIVDVRNSNGGARTLSGVAAGALHATSSEAVNGAQLGAVNDRVELHSVAIAVNRLEIGVNRDGLDELREAFDNFEPDLSGVVRYNADRSVVDLEGAGVAGLAAGEISAGSREAINGSQLFGTNERVGYLEQQQRYVMVGASATNLPAQAGTYGVAVGGNADARADGATAIGSFSNALATNSVAIGRGSYVASEGRDGFALGSRTRVQSVGGLAIGADADVMSGADQSVALGVASVATEADTVSVGSGEYRRRIVSVARGTKDDNVTTLVQLRETVNALGGGASIDAAGGIIGPKYVLSDGTFNNVGAALASIDSKVVSNRSELDTLDSQYKALVQNDRSIRYNDDRSVVDFGGARLTGVADGKLAADSKDAINGGQLFATNQRMEGLEYKQQFISIGSADPSAPAASGVAGVAIGDGSRALGNGATAVGSYAGAMAESSVALGRGSYVGPNADNGFALGTRTGVRATGGIAMGSDSVILEGAHRSIALGVTSVAQEADTVSVGNTGLKRRIVNVGQGIKSDDATTVSQLRGALSALGGGADLDANGNVIGPRYAVQGSEYGSFGDAITALDGSVGDNKRNLDSLDSRLQRLFQESPSVNADGSGRLSFGGAQGMVLGNVANGLIGQGSRDAVNGGQLWAVKEDLQGQIDALDPGKGEVSGSPLAMNGRTGSITPSADGGSTLTSPEATPPAADPGSVAAQDQLVKAEGDNAVAVGSEGKERQVKHVAEGRADTDAANVRQVNDALDRANAYTDSAVASVNQRLDQVDKRINRMAAISSAQSAMAMNTAGLATANRLGAGVGYSEGESAMAVGYQRVLTERGSATFSLNGAFTNSGEKSVGVGVGIGW